MPTSYLEEVTYEATLGVSQAELFVLEQVTHPATTISGLSCLINKRRGWTRGFPQSFPVQLWSSGLEMLRNAMEHRFILVQSGGDGTISRKRKEAKDFHTEPLCQGHLAVARPLLVWNSRGPGRN